MAGNLADIITYVKFLDDVLGVRFTGVEFPIFLLIFACALHHCSAVILFMSGLCYRQFFSMRNFSNYLVNKMSSIADITIVILYSACHIITIIYKKVK